MPTDDHARAIEDAFTTQAPAFEDPAVNRVLTTDSHWVLRRLPVDDGDLVLDVAAGTGLAARELAGRARAVVALDATDAMLARGQAAAAAAGLRNVVFMRGDATALPFLEGSFDAVVCRYAVHHLRRPAEVVAELARCARPGGHVAVADLLADEDPAVGAEQNRLERLRDPSHVRALTLRELEALPAGAGLELVDVTARAVQRPLAPWLDQARGATAAAVAEVHAALQAELGGGVATGFAPRLVDGELWFTHRLASCVALRPR